MYPSFADSLELASILYGIDTDELADTLAFSVLSDTFLMDDVLTLPEAYGYASVGRMSDALMMSDQREHPSDASVSCRDPMATANHSFDYSQSDYVGAF